jgi:ribosomal protein L31
MRKLALLGAVGALAIVAPAQADKPVHPVKPTTAKNCTPNNRGLTTSGTLVAAALTKNVDGTYSGTITVDVTKANHKAPTGSQTYTLDRAKVKFHKGVDPLAPAPSSRVKVHGKITALPQKCSTTGFTPTVTVKNVDVSQPKAPKQ